MNIKFGFTLAEIIIVLGIIGIIAESTIPSLVNTFQKQAYVTGLKKTYSCVENGFKQYIASQGVTELGNTDLFDGTDSKTPARQQIIDNFVKGYFRVSKTCQSGDDSCVISGYSYLDRSGSYTQFAGTQPARGGGTVGNGYYNAKLLDGSMVGFAFLNTCSPDYSKIGNMKAQCVGIFMDVNGPKPPNRYGRDFFGFYAGHDGTLYPMFGIEFGKLADGVNWPSSFSYWKKDNIYCGIPGSDVITPTVTGSACAARIMEEDWQMNY